MFNQIFITDELVNSEAFWLEHQAESPDQHILIVDDDEGLRAVLTFTLLQEGYKVTTAADGLSALQLVQDKKPDFIILDLILPGMGGLELCWRIREFSNVPILILTAIDRDSDKVWALKAGADDYVTKPFSTREIVARIQAILRRGVSQSV